MSNLEREWLNARDDISMLNKVIYLFMYGELFVQVEKLAMNLQKEVFCEDDQLANVYGYK